MRTKKLIVTADDYGMCETVNQAIEECIENGIVLSTNVMVNLEYAWDAKLLRDKYPNISLGLHWNLTVGKPITDEPSLTQENGEFFNRDELMNRIKKGLITKEVVIKELIAQYQRFIDICGKPDYWNTHENLHVNFLLFDLFFNTAINLEIEKMRNHQRVFVKPTNGYTTSIKWRLLNPLKGLVLEVWRSKAEKLGTYMPDGLLVFHNENEKFQLTSHLDNIKWHKANIAELVIHPAISGSHKYFGEVTNKRVKEYKYFSDINLVKDLNDKKIKVCSYKDI